MHDMTKAVVRLWATALDKADIEPSDSFKTLCPDLKLAGDITALVNQWFGTRLTVWQLFRMENSARLAEHLRDMGVPVPPLPPSPSRPIDLTSTDVTKYRRSRWEANYLFSGQAGRATVNSAGWYDSTSRTPLPAAQLREWARNTAERVASLNPASVLDVGCGSGLILRHLAPRCTRYTGTDFSAEAIRLLRDAVTADPALQHVQAFEAAATNFPRHGDDRYDVVLINSVVQYFPDVAYLSTVLSGAVAVTADDGHVFLGDIRHRGLRRAGHFVTVLDGLPGEATVQHGRTSLRGTLDADGELCCSPRELADLVTAIGVQCTVVALVRRGSQLTTMNRFRYDFILSLGERPNPESRREFDWATLATGSTNPLHVLTTLLANDTSSLVVRAIPDLRTIDAERLLESFDNASAETPINTLMTDMAVPLGVDPEDVWSLGEAAGLGVAVAPGATAGYVDVAFSPDPDPWTAAWLLGISPSDQPTR